MDPKTILRAGDKVRFLTPEEATDSGFLVRQYDGRYIYEFPEEDRYTDGSQIKMNIGAEEFELYAGKAAVIMSASQYGGGPYHYHYIVSVGGTRVHMTACSSMFWGYCESDDDGGEIDMPDPPLTDYFCADRLFSALFGRGE